MMLEGLLYINDKDVFKLYGAYLTEEKEGNFTNYSTLMKLPSMKPYTAVNFREEDGEKLPDKLTPAFEPREVTLNFAITAGSSTEFLTCYRAFATLLKSGWLNFYLPELEKTFRVYYQSCGDYEQLTTFGNGMVAARFKVKFREPNPSF